MNKKFKKSITYGVLFFLIGTFVLVPMILSLLMHFSIFPQNYSGFLMGIIIGGIGIGVSGFIITYFRINRNKQELEIKNKLVVQFIGVFLIVFIMYIICYVFKDFIPLFTYTHYSIPFLLSPYLFGFSIMFWYNQYNDKINSFIVASFIPLLYIQILIFFSKYWYDLLHVSIIITAIFIIINRPLNFKYLIIFSILQAVWLYAMTLFNISYIPIFHSVLYLQPGILFYPITLVINIIILYFITKYRKDIFILVINKKDKQKVIHIKKIKKHKK